MAGQGVLRPACPWARTTAPMCSAPTSRWSTRVREVDRNILANTRVLGASQLQIIRHVTVPSALTWIIASLHSAFGFAIVGALVGEVLGAQSGLGLVIKTAQNNFDPNGVFATMLVISVIVLGAEWLIGKLEHRLLAWRPPAPTEANSL